MVNKKSFSQIVQQQARLHFKHIVLVEGGDERTLKAAQIITSEKTARLTLLGDEQEISASLLKLGCAVEAVTIVNPARSEKAGEYARRFYELRKVKGVSVDKAEEVVRDPLYFGTMMVKCGDADGMVAGAVHSTPDTIRPAFQIIKTAEGVGTISGAFFISMGEKTYLFADCGVVENPNVKQLADIALSSALTAKQFGIEPRIAMLSYSTKSSSPSAVGRMMVEAAAIAKQKLQKRFGYDVPVDGELQFDAAFVPEVARRKCPNSPVGGRATVFIFPNLAAGNIAYKAVQRFSGAAAYGPILQGLARPVNDLSRGCIAEDIVATVAITVLQGLDTDKVA